MMRIGRSKECSVVIAQPAVNEHHKRIGSGLWVRRVRDESIKTQKGEEKEEEEEGKERKKKEKQKKRKKKPPGNNR